MVSAWNLISTLVDCCAGWCVWSLAHNLGHRWWHVEMREGKKTFYARGEREHHRVYDAHGQREYHRREDPGELFISFPLAVVAPIGLVFVAGYGLLRGWPRCLPFAAWMYGCMMMDHRLHILFHRSGRLPGVLGWFQQMHLIHHHTHRYNYFFVSGLVWDLLLRTARTNSDVMASGEPILSEQ